MEQDSPAQSTSKTEEERESFELALAELRAVTNTVRQGAKYFELQFYAAEDKIAHTERAKEYASQTLAITTQHFLNVGERLGELVAGCACGLDSSNRLITRVSTQLESTQAQAEQSCLKAATDPSRWAPARTGESAPTHRLESA